MIQKKEARIVARNNWQELLSNPDQTGALLAGVARWIASLDRNNRLLAFVPLPDEPDIVSIVCDAPCPLYLPRITAVGEMEFREWAPGDLERLESGAYGIRQPPDTAPLLELPLGDADSILVPTFGVNRDGIRLGRGGGFYDRWKGRFDGARTVGIVPSRSVDLDFPAEEHDLRLKSVITEAGCVDYR